MNGIKYLLRTNCILGLLKATPEGLEMVSRRTLLASECAYSAMTRIKLLGYLGITVAEEHLFGDRLSKFTYQAITTESKDLAIALRRACKVKLPDAIIAAAAIYHGLELLTFDIALLSIVRSAPSA